ncbi:MAG: ferredoxin-thioredoxin reductase catalytic domain-containing protein [Oscillospiraceae bacterium]
MKVRLNEDKEVVARVKEGLKRTGGYCPCRLARTEENKCMCKEFREQIADPDFEGYCHCMLYIRKIIEDPSCLGGSSCVWEGLPVFPGASCVWGGKL